jgi:hypothetical protein
MMRGSAIQNDRASTIRKISLRIRPFLMLCYLAVGGLLGLPLGPKRLPAAALRAAPRLRS